MTVSGVYDSSPLVVELRVWTDAMMVIAVAGEVDISNGAELRGKIAELISRSTASRVALDLSEVSFLASAGIGVLVHVRRLVEQQGGGQFEIVRAHEHVRQVLDICGLTDLFRLPGPSAPAEG